MLIYLLRSVYKWLRISYITKNFQNHDVKGKPECIFESINRSGSKQICVMSLTQWNTQRRDKYLKPTYVKPLRCVINNRGSWPTLHKPTSGNHWSIFGRADRVSNNKSKDAWNHIVFTGWWLASVCLCVYKNAGVEELWATSWNWVPLKTKILS